MSYIVNFSEQALADSDRLEQNDPKAYKKFLKLLMELAEHTQNGYRSSRAVEGAAGRQMEPTNL